MRCSGITGTSPFRKLETAIGGGLGRGSIGVMVARKGVGKTAFLVGLALDSLMQQRNVLHVALDQPVDKTVHYYDEIFTGLSRQAGLQDVCEARLELERHRRILSYLGNTFVADNLRETVSFFRNHGGFDPDTLIIDGYDLADAGMEQMMEFRRIAHEADAELWMSAVAPVMGDAGPENLPEPMAAMEPSVDVIIMMAHDGEGLRVRILKDHDREPVQDPGLVFDPTSMVLT